MPKSNELNITNAVRDVHLECDAEDEKALLEQAAAFTEKKASGGAEDQTRPVVEPEDAANQA